MPSNYTTVDPVLGMKVDLDELYLSNTALITRFAGIPAWVWGGNTLGTIGDISITNKSSPVTMSSYKTWSMLAGGQSSHGIKNDGTLWSWGPNTSGQLGDNSARVHRSSPTQVGSDANWAYVAGSTPYLLTGVSTGAIRTDGTLWMWGHNNYGQLGDNSARIHRSSPFQVGSDANWSQVATGEITTVAVRTNGTLWAWGYGTLGNIGNSLIAHRSSPTQIGSDTNWSQAAAGTTHELAIRTTGTLWAWGDNSYGQLGDNSARVRRSSPTQIGADTNWAFVSCGTYHTAAVKTNGTLWTWGDNTYGQLGDNSARVHRSSPTQVGSLTTWKSVVSGERHMIALKTDGTIWAWGHNGYGQLGIRDTLHRSSPVQIGSLTTWSKVFATSNNCFAFGTSSV